MDPRREPRSAPTLVSMPAVALPTARPAPSVVIHGEATTHREEGVQ